MRLPSEFLHLILPLTFLSVVIIGAHIRSQPINSQTPTLDQTAHDIESANKTEQPSFRTSVSWFDLWLEFFNISQLAKREGYLCTIMQSFDRDRVEKLEKLGCSDEVPEVPIHSMAAAHIAPLFLNNFEDG